MWTDTTWKELAVPTSVVEVDVVAVVRQQGAFRTLSQLMHRHLELALRFLDSCTLGEQMLWPVILGNLDHRVASEDCACAWPAAGLEIDGTSMLRQLSRVELLCDLYRNVVEQFRFGEVGVESLALLLAFNLLHLLQKMRRKKKHIYKGNPVASY